MDLLVILLAAIVVLLAVALYFLFMHSRRLSSEIEDLGFRKASQSVKYGKLTEQFIPFTEQFPFSRENFRFIGMPIDGIAFEDDKIYICEFKAAGGTLTSKQKNIKRLVDEGKVEWFEFRLG
ncbi:MAG: Holliday junction resolvase-like protein [Candidatus Diapherotrites archaeon]